jgi:hypothetical protein
MPGHVNVKLKYHTRVACIISLFIYASHCADTKLSEWRETVDTNVPAVTAVPLLYITDSSALFIRSPVRLFAQKNVCGMRYIMEGIWAIALLVH